VIRLVRGAGAYLSRRPEDIQTPENTFEQSPLLPRVTEGSLQRCLLAIPQEQTGIDLDLSHG